MHDPWSIERGPAVAFARCSALEIDGVRHAFGLREQDAEHPGWRAFGSERRLRQIHGSRIVRGGGTDARGVEADGAWERVAELTGGFLAVRTADCVPILLASRDGAYVAAVHAGWRGTARRIAARAVAALAEQGCPPGRLVAAVGPSIDACCYPVSAAVATEVARASDVAVEAVTRSGAGPVRLDLRAANRAQLIAAGIPENAVHRAPWCTACESRLFFSFRRDGEAAGRQLSLIGPGRGRP